MTTLEANGLCLIINEKDARIRGLEKRAEAWKVAAEFLEHLSGYGEVDDVENCPLKAARELEEETT